MAVAAGILGWILCVTPVCQPGHSIAIQSLENLTNYPNPFDSRSAVTVIAYTLPSEASVKIVIFDLGGNEIRRWDISAGTEGSRQGSNRWTWDGTDESGSKVAAGGYVCRVMVEEGYGFSSGVRKIGVIR